VERTPLHFFSQFHLNTFFVFEVCLFFFLFVFSFPFSSKIDQLDLLSPLPLPSLFPSHPLSYTHPHTRIYMYIKNVMNVSSSSAVVNSLVVTGATNLAGVSSSPLRLDGGERGGGGGGGSSIGGSAWHATGEPGNLLDDNRSVASSVRSARRRRGAPESTISAGEGKEWSQAFSDLERMQRENKERMQGSVRSGRSSPGEDAFFRSGSTSSCRSSVRRRRWHTASGSGAVNGAGGTATGGEENTLGPMYLKSPISQEETTAAQGISAAVPHLVATAADAELPQVAGGAAGAPAGGAARHSISAARASFLLDSSSFSPMEGDDTDAHTDLQPRLSGLPTWLKRRTTANSQKAATSESRVDNEWMGTEEARSEEAGETNVLAAAGSEPNPSPPLHDRPLYTAASATECKAEEPPNSGPTSPTRKAHGGAGFSASQHGGQPHRTSLPASTRDTVQGGTAFFIGGVAATAATAHSHPSTSVSASPLMQTYLARHTRATAAALAAAAASEPPSSSSTPPSAKRPDTATASTKNAGADLGCAGNAAEAPVSAAGATPVPSSDEAPRKDDRWLPSSAAVPPPPPPPRSPSSSTGGEEHKPEKDMPDSSVANAQLSMKLTVDKNDENESVAANLTGGQGTLQNSQTPLVVVKVAELATAKAATTGVTHVHCDVSSASLSGGTKGKRPARVVYQDLSMNKTTIEHTTITTSTASAKHRVAATAAGATKNGSPSHSVSRDRASPSASRERPSTSVTRPQPSASVAREHRDPSHVRSEASVPRSSRQRKSISMAHNDTAESSAARTSRERSTAAAADKPQSEAPLGHLQRSTALLEMRRQQVLLDRQERERRAAEEERARVGGSIAQSTTVKKRVLTTTMGPVVEGRSNASTSLATPATAAGATQASVKESAPKVGSQAVQAARRPSSTAPAPTVCATSAAASLAAYGKLRLATTNMHGERRSAASSGANVSMTTVVASPIATVSPSLAPPAAAPAVSTPSAAEEPVAAIVAAAPLTTTNTEAANVSPSAVVRGRKPIFNTTSAFSYASAGGAGHAVAASAALPVGFGGVHSKEAEDIRTANPTPPSTMTAGATEASGTPSRPAKPALNPAATRALTHRVDGSTRREVPKPVAGASTGVRRAARRVSTKPASLSSIKSPNCESETVEKAPKPTAAKEEGLKSPPPSRVQQDIGSAPVVSVSVVMEARADESTVPPSSSTLPPAQTELRPAPFCVECGQRHVDEAAKFCAVCGHKRVFL
jgi:hypothetical protein